MLDRDMQNVDIFLILYELTNHKMENWLCSSEKINQVYTVIEKAWTIGKGDF